MRSVAKVHMDNRFSGTTPCNDNHSARERRRVLRIIGHVEPDGRIATTCADIWLGAAENAVARVLSNDPREA
jgi:hypothetical protein